MNRPDIRLLQLMDEERRALLAAEFARLPVIAAEKERLAMAMAQGGPVPVDAPVLSHALSRNAVLIGAALAGLREALMGRDTVFRIYSATGSAETAGAGTPVRLTRRA